MLLKSAVSMRKEYTQIMSSKNWSLEIQNAQALLQSEERKLGISEKSLIAARKRVQVSQRMYRRERQKELQKLVATHARVMIQSPVPDDIMRIIGTHPNTGWEYYNIRLIVRVDVFEMKAEITLLYQDGEEQYMFIRQTKKYPQDQDQWMNMSKDWAKSALYDYLSVFG